MLLVIRACRNEQFLCQCVASQEVGLGYGHFARPLCDGKAASTQRTCRPKQRHTAQCPLGAKPLGTPEVPNAGTQRHQERPQTSQCSLRFPGIRKGCQSNTSPVVSAGKSYLVKRAQYTQGCQGVLRGQVMGAMCF